MQLRPDCGARFRSISVDFGIDLHFTYDIFDLLHGWKQLLPLCGGDAGILVGQIEIFGIGIFNTRLVTRLQRQPLKKAFKLGQGRMQGRLAQLLPGLLSSFALQDGF